MDINLESTDVIIATMHLRSVSKLLELLEPEASIYILELSKMLLDKYVINENDTELVEQDLNEITKLTIE